ncbi:MAG TPA: hypothetical protein VD929_11350 [Caulobacteraceae bacterium]|nr:hypothetical protein [Caulobacteraceae bacterium]
MTDADEAVRPKGKARAWIWRPGGERLVAQSRYGLARAETSRPSRAYEPGAEPKPRRTN